MPTIEFNQSMNQKEAKGEVVMTDKQLLIKAYSLLKKKERLNKEMNGLATSFDQLDKKVIKKIKDYQHYRGIGWDGDNPIQKSEEKVKFPDRVSPVFRNLAEIVYNLKMANRLGELDVYLEAMKDYGIEIKIDAKHEFGLQTGDLDYHMLGEIVDEMDDLQGQICELANILRDDLSENAQIVELCSKKGFKEFLNLFKGKVEKKKNAEKLEEAISKRCETDLIAISKVNEIAKEQKPIE